MVEGQPDRAVELPHGSVQDIGALDDEGAPGIDRVTVGIEDECARGATGESEARKPA